MSRPPLRHPSLIAAFTAAALGSGCVTVYQPLTGLQRPVAVDPTLENFADTRLLVRCLSDDNLDRGDAQTLCRNVGRLFEIQGATVDTQVPRADGGRREEDPAHPPDFVLDLRSRPVHQRHDAWLVILSTLTLTIIPSYEESTYAQVLQIRDGSGSLLSSDELQARFIRYTGLGIWAVNWILDLLVRPKDAALTGDGARNDFSRDFHRQLTQQLFNARMRAQVMHGFEPARPSPPPSPPPVPSSPPGRE